MRYDIFHNKRKLLKSNTIYPGYNKYKKNNYVNKNINIKPIFFQQIDDSVINYVLNNKFLQNISNQHLVLFVYSGGKYKNNIKDLYKNVIILDSPENKHQLKAMIAFNWLKTYNNYDIVIRTCCDSIILNHNKLLDITQDILKTYDTFVIGQWKKGIYNTNWIRGGCQIISKSVIDSFTQINKSLIHPYFREANDVWFTLSIQNNKNITIIDKTLFKCEQTCSYQYPVWHPIQTNSKKNKYNKFININKSIKYDTKNIIFAITTYNRLKYLKQTIESWNRTRCKDFKWTLIIADDGSTDGTLKYIQSLDIKNVKIYPIYNKNTGVHHQTNMIFKLSLLLNFDFAFKSDDDIIFKKEGWDIKYINESEKNKFYHLCFNDIKWLTRKGNNKQTITKDNLQSSVDIMNCQGALWTYNKEILKSVGFFDVDIFENCGYGHIDFTNRCIKLGYNQNPVFDIKNSNDYIELIQGSNYKESPNPNRLIFNTESKKEKKIKTIKNNNRIYIDYKPIKINLYLKSFKHKKYSFIIPFRHRNEHKINLIKNINKFYNDYEIIFVEQDDDLLFRRGQLCNIGFLQSIGDIIIFHDVDIRHYKTINFSNLLTTLPNTNLGIVCFNKISDIEEYDINKYKIIQIKDRPDAYGGCTAFIRENFIKSFGFSNIIRGWGGEDNILHIRSNLFRLNNTLLHVQHNSINRTYLRSLEWNKINVNNFLSEKTRLPEDDNYRHMTYEIKIDKIKDNITLLKCKNISVCPNFKYKKLIYKEKCDKW